MNQLSRRRSAVVWTALLITVAGERADAFLTSDKAAHRVLAMSYIVIGAIIGAVIATNVLS